MLVRMELSRIFIREMTDMQIIELSEVGGSRTFPIVIGLPEAFAIERRLKGLQIERPQTHDLLASVIEHLGAELKRVVINDLAEGTFFARLMLEQDGESIEVDCRPSDAIALAVAEDVPIDVAEHVLEQTASDSELDLLDEDEFAADDDDDEDDEGNLNWD